MASILSLRRLQTFCVYCSLKSGAIVAVGLITLYYILFPILLGFWLIWLAEWKRDGATKKDDQAWHITSIVVFVFALLNVLVILLLIIAMSKHYYRLLIAGLVFFFLSIAANVIHLAHKIGMLSRVTPSTPTSTPIMELFESIVYDILFCGMMSYLWAIILSFYLQVIDPAYIAKTANKPAEDAPATA